MRTTLASLVLTALLASAAFAAQLRSPFTVVGRNPALNSIDVETTDANVVALAAQGDVTLRGVALPGGVTLDLDLRRVDLARMRFEYRVDGAPAAGLLDGLELSVWMGRVAGVDDSEVALSFSRVGCRGWVRAANRLFHLIPDGGRMTWIDESSYVDAGLGLREYCGSEELAPSASLPRSPRPAGPLSRSTSLYECKVAVETDYQLFQKFSGNLASETAYVTTLMAWVSYRYEEQIGTVLTYPYVQFYTTAGDPWSTQESGGSSVDLLYEFQGAWAYAIPAGGKLATFLSGASLGGGVAWLPGLCNAPYNFSVCGNINGLLSFPIQQQPNNWDFMVTAHELGHNFGSPHTHSYCPPLDQCAPSGYFGGCQTQQVCTSQGTLMSYCHLCSGGTANITTYFHPACVADMRYLVETTCLPLYCADPTLYCVGKVNSAGCTPAIAYTGHPTLSGLDDFHVRATLALNQQNGIFFWGLGPANAPFQDGTRCVATPFERTPVQFSGGTVGPADCSGTYDFFFSHAYAAAQSLGGGSSLFGQYWMRDPSSASTTGLSNAIHFTLTN